jgi:hypothetical protein
MNVKTLRTLLEQYKDECEIYIDIDRADEIYTIDEIKPGPAMLIIKGGYNL